MFKKRYYSIIALISIFICLVLILICINNTAFAFDNDQSHNSDKSVTKIYFTDDVHGNFQNVSQKNGISYATVKALKQKTLEAGDSSFAIYAGDDLWGNCYTDYDHGSTVSTFLNDVGYDFKVPGNHELDYGVENFLNNYNKNNDYYACNFYNGTPQTKQSDVLKPYKIVEGAGGQKIAFIGLMTQETILTASPSYFQDQNGNWTKYINDATTSISIYDAFNSAIAKAKEEGGENTICIGVGHLGNKEYGIEHKIDSETVVSKSQGLVAFIDAHSHTAFNKTIADKDGNFVTVIQAASGLERTLMQENTGMNRIGEIIIDNTGLIKSAKILTSDDPEISSIVPDANLVEAQRNWIANVNSAMSTVVSYNDNIDTSISKKKICSSTTNITDLITDAVYYYTYSDRNDGKIAGSDVVLLNSGIIRDNIKEAFRKKENISLQNCSSIFKSNIICMAEITGQTLLDALEYSVRDYPNPNNNGSFLQSAGITYYVNTDIASSVQVAGEDNHWVGPPTGEYRVNGLQIFDKESNKFVPINLNAKYKVVSTELILKYLDSGYKMFNDSKILYTYSENCIDDYKMLAYYLANFSTEKNINVLKSEGSPIHTKSFLINYPINYEDPLGAQKVKLGVAPITDNSQSNLSSVSSFTPTTSDSPYSYYLLIIVIFSINWLIHSSKKIRLINSKIYF